VGAEPLKVPYVAGGDGRLPRRRNAGDLHVTNVDTAPEAPALGGDSRCMRAATPR